MPFARLALALVAASLVAACGGVEDVAAPVAGPVSNVAVDDDALAGHLDAENEAIHGPVEVTPGSLVTLRFSSTGAARLTVRFGDAPSALEYDGGAKPGAVITLKATGPDLYLRVVAEVSTDYAIDLRTSIPMQAAPHAYTRESFEGALEAGQAAEIEPLAVTPGSTIVLLLDGSGDGDLTARFDAAPTADAYDCLGISEGADMCRLVVPEGARFLHARVVAISSTRFTLEAVRP